MKFSRRHGKPGRMAQQCYAILLRGYPSAFRAEYAEPMAQLFRDSYRRNQTNGRLTFWLRLTFDVFRTAPQEHLDQWRKETSMKSWSRDIIGLLGCVIIIALAMFLLSYGRKHEASSILMFGHALDAIVVTGVIGNLIVFLLVKLTRFDHLKIALWTFLLINAIPAIALAILGSKIDPQFNAAATLIGYVASFAFWFVVHWIWSRTAPTVQAAA